MILTFAKLQRMSKRTKPSAVKAWLKREGVAYIRDADGNPFTTLDALNRKLHRAADDGFTLNDPEGGLPEKRTVVSRRPKPLDCADQGGRGADGAPTRLAGTASYANASDGGRIVDRLFTVRGNRKYDEAGI